MSHKVYSGIYVPEITEKDLGLTKLLQKFEGCNFLGHSVVTAELAING